MFRRVVQKMAPLAQRGEVADGVVRRVVVDVAGRQERAGAPHGVVDGAGAPDGPPEFDEAVKSGEVDGAEIAVI
ncbi:hypothetical protein [Lichenibacterium dinghuense]|uniref:hypothetical protein n=1 Tax=Lichenibacterium dinghuense TaxID=2895977 RepID=UPI002814A32D|nr:hypothetical protein [Lichenibacterium sp. 6Y81]